MSDPRVSKSEDVPQKSPEPSLPSSASTPTASIVSKSSSPDVSNLPSEKGTEGEMSRSLQIRSSVRRVVVWTMTGFFDWNPGYLMQIRGIMNILHMLISLATLSLLALSCQLRPYPNGPSEGFYCKPPETFLFVVACSSFLCTTMILFSCLLSKRTDSLIFETSYEITNFIVYFILFLTASVTLMVSTITWGTERIMYGNDYNITQSAAISGLINSVLYGVSSVWFFISHRFHTAAAQNMGVNPETS